MRHVRDNSELSAEIAIRGGTNKGCKCTAQREISGHLLGEPAIGMAEVGELLIAA
jgi:hypothetical protein